MVLPSAHSCTSGAIELFVCDEACIHILFRILVIGLANGSLIALNAMAVTLVYGVVQTISFAHGDLFALSTVAVALILSRFGLSLASPPLLLVVGLAAAAGVAMGGGALLNLTVERMAFRPFRGGSRIAPLIATIGISFMLYQAALGLRYITNVYIPGEHRSVPGMPEVPHMRINALVPTIDVVRALGLNLPIRYALPDLLVLLVASAVARYYLALLLVLFVAVGCLRLTASRLGRAWVCH